MTDEPPPNEPAGESWEEVSCSLCVFSEELSPSDVTACVGVEPTHIRERGAPIRGGRTVATNQWIWKAPDEVPNSLDAQIEAIRRGIGNRIGSFRSLAGANVVLDVVIYHRGESLRLGWVLKGADVALAAELGASISVDEYDYTGA